MHVPALPDRQRALPAGATLVALFAVWMATTRYDQGNPLPATLLVLAVGGLIILRQPKIAVIGAVAVGATLLPPGAYYRSIGGVSTSLAEVFVYAAVGAWVVHRLMGRAQPQPRVVHLLCLIVLFAIVGAIVALTRGVQVSVVHGLLQTFGWYLFVLPVCAFFASQADKALLERWVLFICTTASVIELSLLALGRTVVSDSNVALVIRGQAESINRVRPSLLELVVLGTVLVVARAGQEGWGTTRVIRVLLFGSVLLFSFTRIIWMSTVVALLVVKACRPGHRDFKRIMRGLVLSGVLLPTLYLGATRGLLGEPGRLAVQRAGEVFSPDIVQDSSYTYRTRENHFALQAIERDPLLGAGLGATFGFAVDRYDPRANRVVKVDAYYLHNSYLFAWVALGLGGILALLSFAAAVATYAIRWIPRLPTDDAVRCLAGAGALLGYGISAVWQPQLFHAASILALCLAVGLLVRPLDQEAA